MPSILLRDPEKLPVKVLLHSMYGGEIGGSEAFGRRYVLATKEGTDQLPWELALVNARLTWDECRHTEIVLEQMAKNGCTLGDFVDGYMAGESLSGSSGSTSPGAALDMVNSMASVHRGGEGLAMNLFTALIDMGRNIDDPDWERAFDFNHADEVMHVEVGNYWVPRLTEGNDGKRREAIAGPAGLRGVDHGAQHGRRGRRTQGVRPLDASPPGLPGSRTSPRNGEEPMSATESTERPFYRPLGPGDHRRDPPHRYLSVDDRENWRENGIDLASILLRDPEKMSRRVLLHAMYNGEIGGAETFARRYVMATREDDDQLPWELALVNARLAWDECRHAEIVLAKMPEHGVTLGDFADGYRADDGAVSQSGEQNMVNSMAAVHRGGEGMAMNLFTSLIDMGRNIGDKEWETAFDFNHADEVMHVEVGNYWVPRLTEGDAAKRREAMEAQQAFEELVMALNTGDEVLPPEDFAL